MSKNIRRDDFGHPILNGAETFGTIVRPRGGKRQARTCELKRQATDRLVALMTDSKAKVALMGKREIKILKEQNDFANMPPIARLHYYMQKVIDLNQELNDLRSKGNVKRLELYEGVITKQIEEMRQRVVEVYAELLDSGYSAEQIEGV